MNNDIFQKEITRYISGSWFPDSDGDGVADQADCVPWDPEHQHLFSGVIGWGRRRVSSARRRVSSARRSVSSARRRVSKRVSEAVREAPIHPSERRGRERRAQVRQAVGRRIKGAKEFAAASPQERARRVTRGADVFREKHATTTPSLRPDIKGVHEVTARVGKTIRGFEPKIDKPVRGVERALGLHSKHIPKSLRIAGGGVKEFGYGVALTGTAGAVEMAGMIPGGIHTMAKKPAVIPAAAAYGTYAMGAGLYEGVTKHPARTAGEFVTFAALSKATPKIPLPEVSRGALGGVPTPKGLAPGKAIKFEAGYKLAQRLKGVEAPKPHALDYSKEVAQLPGKAGTTVETWLKTSRGQDPVVFGSAASRAQMRGARLPMDLDVAVKNPGQAAREVGALLSKKIGAKNVRVSKNMVETRVGGKWDHAVDFHAKSEMTGRMTYGFKTQRPIKIGGVKYIRIGEQLTRKGASVLTQRGKTIGPAPHRAEKDIGDFLAIAQQLSKKQMVRAETSPPLLKQIRIRSATKTEKLIPEYKYHSGLYMEPALRQYYTLPKYVRRPPAIGLAGFGYPKTEHPKTEYPKTKYPTTKYPTTGYPTTTKTMYPKTTKTAYPKTMYPKTMYPKTRYPKTTKTAYPKTTKTEYPKTTKTEYPKTTKTEYPKTTYPTTTKIAETFAPTIAELAHTTTAITPKPKEGSTRAKASERRKAIDWRLKHQLVTLSSFLGGGVRKPKKNGGKKK